MVDVKQEESKDEQEKLNEPNFKRRTSQRNKIQQPTTSVSVPRRTSSRVATALAAKTSQITQKTAEITTDGTKIVSKRNPLFKSTRPLKAPSEKATCRIHQSLFNGKGFKFQVGDIVSMIDEENGKDYFAQIRGLLTDIYTEKFVVINWLAPLFSCRNHIFVPNQFVHVLSDSRFYLLEKCAFVQHAPNISEYQREWNPPLHELSVLRNTLEQRWKNLRKLDDIVPSLTDV